MRIDASPTETELITTNPEQAQQARQQLAANEQEAQQKMAEIEANATAAGPGSIEETVRVLVAEAMAELMSEQQKA
jgi:hypothetical protein